jgi:hypothetical protein
MSLKRVPFRVTIEINGIFLDTTVGGVVNLDDELHQKGWDALEHFNAKLLGHMHIYKGIVTVDVTKPVISEDRRDNP